ncbi:alpha-L-rhamnosidase-related protein [Dyadobacter crusticola]|uniref:alpha-L-rhamnosidase-related protein n=1 Tax=Dyadobacter crusticola TaxID=292407 RepID=UPI000A9C48C2|nr:alpha-L-rhamnosidase C-terminal domain-containing protein [Dyadobacter crusticola]
MLAELLRENGGKLATGFLGAKPLLPALSATGHSDLAYKLFLSKEFPSWGFEVENGSTTIWERWDSFTKEDGFKYNAAMNSFSHYAFGAVCEWMFGNAAGIKATKPGFAEFDIRPEIAPDGMERESIGRLAASLRTMNGLISSQWAKTQNGLTMKVAVPVNTTARIYIPQFGEKQISLNGREIRQLKQVKILGKEDGYTVVEAGSGTYEFIAAH